MPSLPIIKTEKLIRILKKNGLTVDMGKGKGSHAKAYGSRGTFITLPKTLNSPSVRSTIAKFLINEGFDIDKMFR